MQVLGPGTCAELASRHRIEALFIERVPGAASDPIT